MSQIKQFDAAPESRRILGLRVHLVPPGVYLDRITEMAASGKSGYCCVANVHHCMVAHDEADFRAITEEADLLVSDSAVLQKAIAFRHRIEVPPAMFGADIMLELCRRAEREGFPVALIGGRSEEVLERLRRALQARFPRLEIAFAYSPPFRPAKPEETERLVAEIRASGARLAFIGLGCPKQERWMAAHKSMLGLMMIGVGAAFDYNSGEVKPSPAWVHKSGLEWFYRLLNEPRRLWRRYLTTSPRFLALLALDMIRSPRASSR